MAQCQGCGVVIGEDYVLCAPCTRRRENGPLVVMTDSLQRTVSSNMRFLNRLGFAIGVPGLFLPGVAWYLWELGTIDGRGWGLACAVVGVLLQVVGLSFAASVKGRSPLWGLMGFTWIPGWFMLWLIPKACHHCRALVDRKADICPECAAPL